MVPDSTTMIHSSWILALLMDLTLTTRWSYSWAKLFSFYICLNSTCALAVFTVCVIRYCRLLTGQNRSKQVVPVQDETFPNMWIFMFQFPGGTDNYLTISGSSHPFLSSSSEVGFVVRTRIWRHWDSSSFKHGHVASAGAAFADQGSPSASERIGSPEASVNTFKIMEFFFKEPYVLSWF